MLLIETKGLMADLLLVLKDRKVYSPGALAKAAAKRKKVSKKEMDEFGVGVIRALADLKYAGLIEWDWKKKVKVSSLGTRILKKSVQELKDYFEEQGSAAVAREEESIEN